MSVLDPADADGPTVLVMEPDYSVLPLTIDKTLQLRTYFEQQPEELDARDFVNEALAASWADGGAHSAADIEALPKSIRQKMLRDVVVSNGYIPDWNSLRGSGLSFDERLYTIMRDEWQRREQFYERIRARYAELKALGAFEGLLGKAISGMVMITEFVPAYQQLIRGLPPLPVRRVNDIHRGTPSAAFGSAQQVLRQQQSVGVIEQISKLAGTRTTGILGSRFSSDRVVEPFRDHARLRRSLSLMPSSSGLTRLVEHTYDLTNLTGVSSRGLIPPPSPGMLTVLDWFRQFQLQRDFFESLREAEEKADRYERRWQGHRLSYLASGLLVVADILDIGLLDALDDKTATDAFLHLLEEVVLDGKFIPLLREAVSTGPFLTGPQRQSLDSALASLSRLEWVPACNNLYIGLEGAFWEVAYERQTVTCDRMDSKQPTKELGFDAMVKKLLAAEPEFATWMVRALYGTVGDPYRHGGAKNGHRQQALFAMVALAGWFQSFTTIKAWDLLIASARLHIPIAVQRVGACQPSARYPVAEIV